MTSQAAQHTGNTDVTAFQSPVATTSVTWESNIKTLGLSSFMCKMRSTYILSGYWKDCMRYLMKTPGMTRLWPWHSITLCSFPRTSPHTQWTHSANQRKPLSYKMAHNLFPEATRRLSPSPSTESTFPRNYDRNNK